MSVKRKILVVIDGSYTIYYLATGAFSNFLKTSDQAGPFQDPDSIDQDNLPDILNCTDYRKELHNYVMKRLQTIDWILKNNFQQIIDDSEGIDFIFAMDDKLANNFRKKEYPAYKAQRKLIKRSFDMNKVRQYVTDVLFPELQLEEKYGYRVVKVSGAEGDDVVACVLDEFQDYALRVLIASDKDFLQIPNVRQFNLMGEEIVRKVKDTGEILNEKDFLLWKILRGDTADNIPGVFKGVGEKKSLKLVKDRDKLRSMLKESKESFDRFSLNKRIIDFRSIPDALRRDILMETRRKLSNVSGKPISEMQELALDGFMEL